MISQCALWASKIQSRDDPDSYRCTVFFTQANVHVQIAVQIAVERRTPAPVANHHPRISLHCAHAVIESLTCMHPRKRACSNGFKF